MSIIFLTYAFLIYGSVTWYTVIFSFIKRPTLLSNLSATDLLKPDKILYYFFRVLNHPILQFFFIFKYFVSNFLNFLRLCWFKNWLHFFFRTDCRSLLSVSVFLCFQERYSVWRNRRIEQGSMLHHLSFCCLSGKLCLRKNPHLLWRKCILMLSLNINRTV